MECVFAFVFSISLGYLFIFVDRKSSRWQNVKPYNVQWNAFFIIICYQFCFLQLVFSVTTSLSLTLLLLSFYLRAFSCPNYCTNIRFLPENSLKKKQLLLLFLAIHWRGKNDRKEKNISRTVVATIFKWLKPRIWNITPNNQTLSKWMLWDFSTLSNLMHSRIIEHVLDDIQSRLYWKCFDPLIYDHFKMYTNRFGKFFHLFKCDEINCKSCTLD